MNDWKPRMQKTVRHLAEQLSGIRTGTISMRFIETVRVGQPGQFRSDQACRGHQAAG